MREAARAKPSVRPATDWRATHDFVIHSLRHTMLTRLGESGVDAFTIMGIAGHSSITVSQRYVHPTPEAVERTFERLQLSGSQGKPSRKCCYLLQNSLQWARRSLYA